MKNGSNVYLYRPQRSWAKVIFSQACVKNSVRGGGTEGVCLSTCWDIPSREQTPPSRHPPGQTPQSRHPPRTRTPPGPDPRHTHPPEADYSIRSTSGRYASYWNAFLFLFKTGDHINSFKKRLALCGYYFIFNY